MTAPEAGSGELKPSHPYGCTSIPLARVTVETPRRAVSTHREEMEIPRRRRRRPDDLMSPKVAESRRAERMLDQMRDNAQMYYRQGPEPGHARPDSRVEKTMVKVIVAMVVVVVVVVNFPPFCCSSAGDNIQKNPKTTGCRRLLPSSERPSVGTTS